MWWALNRFYFHLLSTHHMAMEETIITMLLGWWSDPKLFTGQHGGDYVGGELYVRYCEPPHLPPDVGANGRVKCEAYS